MALSVLVFISMVLYVVADHINCGSQEDCSCIRNEPCTIICGGGKDYCKGRTLRCRPNFPCTIDCISDVSCSNAQIDGSQSTNLNITCNGLDACKGTHTGIECGTGHCLLSCNDPDGGTACMDINVRTNHAISFICIGSHCGDTLPNQYVQNTSLSPTTFPTQVPTVFPTISTTQSPTALVSDFPTVSPTVFPTLMPTGVPTMPPSLTENPALSHSISPSASPMQIPTFVPTESPTNTRSLSPSYAPTTAPSSSPSKTPSTSPLSPSTAPSVPSTRPTNATQSQHTTVSPAWRPSFSPAAPITLTLYPVDAQSSESTSMFENPSTQTMATDTRYFWYTVAATSIILLCYGAVCVLCYVYQTHRMQQLLAARKAEDAMAVVSVVEGKDDHVNAVGSIHQYQPRDMNQEGDEMSSAQGTEEVSVGNTIKIHKNTLNSETNTNCDPVMNVKRHKCSVETTHSDLTSVTASTVHICVRTVNNRKRTTSLPTIPSDNHKEEDLVPVVECSLSENVEPKLDTVSQEPLSMMCCKEMEQEQIEYENMVQNNRNIECLKFAMDYLSKNESQYYESDRRDTVLTADHEDDGTESQDISLDTYTQNTGLIHSVLGNIFGMESIDDINHQNASLSNISSE
eukprot:133625_1